MGDVHCQNKEINQERETRGFKDGGSHREGEGNFRMMVKESPSPSQA